MKLPECWDPISQEDARQKRWDDFAEELPVCALCRQRLYPGDRFHTARYQIVCPSCKEELDENEDIVEVS